MINRSSGGRLIRLSMGPDKTKGTRDDIACIGKFRRDVEDGRFVSAKDVSWSLPEGLGSLVEEYTDKPYGKIEYTKAVKPEASRGLTSKPRRFDVMGSGIGVAATVATPGQRASKSA